MSGSRTGSAARRTHTHLSVAVDIDGLVIAGERSVEQKCLEALHKEEAAYTRVAARGVHGTLSGRHGHAVGVSIEAF